MNTSRTSLASRRLNLPVRLDMAISGTTPGHERKYHLDKYQLPHTETKSTSILGEDTLELSECGPSHGHTMVCDGLSEPQEDRPPEAQLGHEIHLLVACQWPRREKAQGGVRQRERETASCASFRGVALTEQGGESKEGDTH